MGHQFDPYSGKIPHASEQLSPCTTAADSRAFELQLTEARVPRAHAPQQEKPSQWEAHTLQWRVAPARCILRKQVCSNKDPPRPKKN